MGFSGFGGDDDFDLPVVNLSNRVVTVGEQSVPSFRKQEEPATFSGIETVNVSSRTQPAFGGMARPSGTANLARVTNTTSTPGSSNVTNNGKIQMVSRGEKVNIDELLKKARLDNCSDVHITAGTAIALRKYGELIILKEAIPSLKESEEMIYSLMDDVDIARFKSGEDVDIATTDSEGKRMRVNVYRQRNNIACSIRLINSEIPTLEQLGMPSAVKTFADAKNGLVLITGPTGSGKSTTLASMINYINRKYARHIMTIEDPIEYVYPFDKAMIHQRQVGKDADSFASALRSSLREDPDIILVGEMRDYETISAAITAAETGHLVFSTLHTKSAAQTIERIISESPIEAHQSIISQLSNVLVGCVTQSLIPLADGSGRVAATEVLVNNMAVSNLIKEKKISQINSTLQTSSGSGMHTMNASLVQLVRTGKITSEEALSHSNAVPELSKELLTL